MRILILVGCLALGGCTTVQGWFGGPSTPSQLNALAAEESAITVAYNTADLWARSGHETAAQAGVVESVRRGIDGNMAAARAARDAGNNVALAQALNLVEQGVRTLTNYMLQNGAPKP
jgi:hypothetical protein